MCIAVVGLFISVIFGILLHFALKLYNNCCLYLVQQHCNDYFPIFQTEKSNKHTDRKTRIKGRICFLFFLISPFVNIVAHKMFSIQTTDVWNVKSAAFTGKRSQLNMFSRNREHENLWAGETSHTRSCMLVQLWVKHTEKNESYSSVGERLKKVVICLVILYE